MIFNEQMINHYRIDECKANETDLLNSILSSLTMTYGCCPVTHSVVLLFHSKLIFKLTLAQPHLHLSNLPGNVSRSTGGLHVSARLFFEMVWKD